VRLTASTGAQASQTTKFLWDRKFSVPQLTIERNGSDTLLGSYRLGWTACGGRPGPGIPTTTTTLPPRRAGLGRGRHEQRRRGPDVGEYYPYALVSRAGNGSGAPAVRPLGFTGEPLDSVTGLCHLRARQHDAGTGRCLSTDPSPATTDPYISGYVYASDRATVLGIRQRTIAFVSSVRQVHPVRGHLGADVVRDEATDTVAGLEQVPGHIGPCNSHCPRGR